MKIDPTGPVSPARLKRTEKRGKTGGSAFTSHLASGTPAGGGAEAPGPVTSVASLLALQEVPDAATGRSKGLARGEDMLDRLDDIRHGLLMGQIDVGDLETLAHAVHKQRAEVKDPKLASVLDEIELRAAVELAKLGH